MDNLSPQAQENRNAAKRSFQYRKLKFDQGPHLSNDGSKIWVPSPRANGPLKEMLRLRGFQFQYSNSMSYWWRWTRKGYNDLEQLTPDQWLEWAIVQYAAAWPDWEEA